MLDTIKITFEFNNKTGEYIEGIEEEIYEVISEILYKTRYCNEIKTKLDRRSISLILSYPRYFNQTNAFLITNKRECLEVNKGFINRIRDEIAHYEHMNFKENIGLLDWFDNNVTIKIKRVDVAFTYYMKEHETFSSYRNIYLILNRIYRSFNKKSIPKNIGVLETGEMETLIFANTANVGSFDHKVTIYDQNKKFDNYYNNTNPELLNRTLENFPDLKQRIRIETSKRVDRKIFSLDQFEDFDIFSAYVPQYAEYALYNLFNGSMIEAVYIERIEKLKAILMIEKQYSNFNYQSFVYKYIDEIWDYEMIRVAIMESTCNPNTGYQACSTVREVLEKYEQNTGIIFFGVINKITDMSKMLNKQTGRLSDGTIFKK